jgi:hypothetical protein
MPDNISRPPAGGGLRRPLKRQVGVCILRVEGQEDYLIITVTTNRQLGRSLMFASPERTERFANPGDALRMAEQFLESFR